MGTALQGTVAVVTGASSGIGAATARTLAEHGASVALLARRQDRLQALAEEIGQRATTGTSRPSIHPVDLSDVDAATAAIEQIAADHGHIDVLVNNAGYGSWSPALEGDLAEWHRMISVNIEGVFAVTRAALPHLVTAAQGPRTVSDVVMVSSIAGRRVPGFASNVYAATKHAVGGFSEALRQELAESHVRVGLIEPGIVTSELTTSGAEYAPDAREASPYLAMDPEHIADAIGYMVTRSPRVAINEILLRPTEQVR